MKRNNYILILFLILFVACEKVIDVDLNKSKPVVVIEGNLTNSPAFLRVKVSKSGSYFGNEQAQLVINANVTIENNFGGNIALEEVEDGHYTSRDVYPQVGNSYTLNVDVEGVTYTAVSKINRAVKIDSLSYFFDDGFAFIDAGYNVKVHFTDVFDEANYYRLKIYYNDSLKNELDDFIVFDDRLIDGKNIEITLTGKTFEIGDTATVELISLDKGAYTYFNTFQELIATNPGSAAPANPTSNLSNGALGYFSAWSSSKKSIIIR